MFGGPRVGSEQTWGRNLALRGGGGPKPGEKGGQGP